MIKMLTSIAGPGFSYAPGDIPDPPFDAVTNKNLIAKGLAEPVKKSKSKSKSKAE